MRFWIRLRMAMKTLFQRENETARLNDELDFHLEQQTAENIAAGMDPIEARLAALRTFGNPTHLREETRMNWSWNWLETFWRDVRYGTRTLSRAPGFALVAVLVMALGIGATTSLFTIVRSVLLRPLPFPDSDRLVMVYEHFRESPDKSFNYNPVSPADYRDWRTQTHGFDGLAAWRYYGANLTGDHAELPEVVAAAAGTSNFFSVLGVPPALGRSFTQEEDRVGANSVVMLTWGLYQRRFGGNPSVVGQTIRLDSKPYTIVGILPKWFNYPDNKVQLWVPYASTFTAEVFEHHDFHQSLVIGRLRSGVSAEAAVREVSALQYQLHMQYKTKPVAEDAVYRPLIEDVVQDVKTPLIVLLCAVGCMLLIACLNVSNLLVARGAARRKEVAVRGALGGSRLTLIREQMTESLLICVAGGTLGLLLSFGATKWLAAHWKNLPRADAVHVDGAVLGFAILLIVLAALLAGLLPALSSTGKGLFTALQDSSRSVRGSSSRATLRKTMLTAEIALTVVLLVAAGLLFKSFLHLRTANLGCVTDDVLTIKYGLPEKQYDTPAKVLAFHEALLARVRSQPGVKAASLVTTAPGDGYEGDDVFTIPEHPPQASILQYDAMYRSADPSYFRTMQIPLLRGRFFNDNERLDRYQYTIVNNRFANQYFPGEDPIGKHIVIHWSGKDETYEIVGVVGDTLYDVTKEVKPTAFFPLFSGIPSQTGTVTIVARAAGDPLALAIPIQKQIAQLDAALPTYDIFTMQQIVSKNTASESFSATLVLAFAGLSLMLAAAGLYGVLSYLVTQRVTEIGIRLALGAQRQQVLKLILFDGMRPVFVGLCLGIAGGAAAGKLIQSQTVTNGGSVLYGTQALDLPVYVVMIVCLVLTAVAACAIPALQASKIEPMRALRTE